jgi:hypothetical protein
MSADEQERAKELARLWQGAVVPVEDEAVSAARRERLLPAIGGAIARSAEQRRRAMRFRRVVGAFAVAASVAGALVVGRAFFTHDKPVVAVSRPESGVVAVSGVVTLMHDAHESVVERAALSVGDSVTTALDATAEVRLTNLVLASVAGSSELDVVPAKASIHRLRLDRGRIDAKVDDRPSPTPKLVVETPDVEVVVTGTMFEVDVTGAEANAPAHTRVSVTKGRVVVRRAGVEVAAVTAGQSWSSEAPKSAESTSSGQAVAPPVPEKDVARHDTAQRSVTANPAIAAAPKAALPSAGNLDDAQLGTLAEENSLFQSAIEARKRGDDASVANQLATLLSRFPGSPLASEARVERMRALSRLGRREEAAREARRYLAERPDGFARDEAKRLVMPGGTSE